MDNDIEERSSMETILEYTQLLLHWVWLLLLVALIAGYAGYFFTNRQTRMYQSSTLVMVNGASGSSDTYSSISIGQQLVDTYVNTMTTAPMLQAVSDLLGYPVYSGNISVESITNTSLIKITVIDTDPNRAAEIANTLVSVFSEKIVSDQTSRYSELKTSLEDELQTINKQIDVTQQKIITLNSELDVLTNQLSTQTASSSTKSNEESDLSSEKSALLLAVAEYENSLTQYQQSRYYSVQSYQDLKLAEAQSVTSIVQKDPAVPNNIPIKPQPIKSGLLAAIVGFMVSAGIVFLVEFLNDTIRNPEEITRKWGVPVIGVIVNYNSIQNHIITMFQPRAPVSESFRSLRTNIQFAGVNKPLHTILVTSASPQDGKTSVVSNLANVFAQNEREVVLIDADLRRPRIHKVFQLSNRIGLSDYFIRSKGRLNGIVKLTNEKRLCVVTSGSLPPNPSELLSSDKMMELLAFLGKHFDTIIIDSPPILAVTDALVLAPRMDGVILVMDPKRTKRAALKHCIEQLSNVNANLLGVVVNNVKIKQSPYYFNRKYYYGKHGDKNFENPTLTEESPSIINVEKDEPEKEPVVGDFEGVKTD